MISVLVSNLIHYFLQDKDGRNVDLGGLIITSLPNEHFDGTEEMAVDADTSADKQTTSTNLLSS